MNRMVRPPRDSVEISLDRASIAEAEALGIDLSQACERGLRATIEETRASAWREQNRAAIDDYNRLLAGSGLPLAGYSLI